MAVCVAPGLSTMTTRSGIETAGPGRAALLAVPRQVPKARWARRWASSRVSRRPGSAPSSPARSFAGRQHQFVAGDRLQALLAAERDVAVRVGLRRRRLACRRGWRSGTGSRAAATSCRQALAAHALDLGLRGTTAPSPRRQDGQQASALCLSDRPLTLVPSSLAPVARVAPSASSSRAIPRASRVAALVEHGGREPARPGRAAGRRRCRRARPAARPRSAAGGTPPGRPAGRWGA